MSFRYAFIVAVLLLSPLSQVFGDELIFGLTSGLGYNSNVGNQTRNEKDDYSVRITPLMTLRNHDEALTYDLSYRPTAIRYFDYDQYDSWDHIVNGSLRYQVSPATSLSISDNFVAATSDGGGGLYGDGTGGSTGQAKQRRKYNSIRIGVTHAFSSRTSADANIFQSFTNYGQETQRDNDTFGFDAGFTHSVSLRGQAGLRASFTQQNFDSVGQIRSTSTRYYNLSGVYLYTFDPTWTLSISAGPALVDQDKTKLAESYVVAQYPAYPWGDGVTVSPYAWSSCKTDPDLLAEERLLSNCSIVPVRGTPSALATLFPGFNTNTVTASYDPASLPKIDDTSMTLFAALLLTKEWQRSTLSFEARQSATSDTGLGAQGSTVNTLASVRYARSLSSRWSLSLLGQWSKYKSSGDSIQPIFVVIQDNSNPTYPDVAQLPATGARILPAKTTSGIDYEINTASVGMSYQITKRLSANGSISYLKQKNNNNYSFYGVQRYGVRQDYDAYRAFLGFTYQFEALHF